MTNTPPIERLAEFCVSEQIDSSVSCEADYPQAEGYYRGYTAAAQHIEQFARTLTPSAGEVERVELIRRVEAGLNLGSLLTGDVPCSKQALDTLNFAYDALKALASPPLPHPDIEGRARDAFEKVESYIYGLECKALADIRPPEVQAALESLSLPTTEIRREALEEAAAIADKWAAENKQGAADARRCGRNRNAFDGDETQLVMADQLEGAAIECNAIAQEIRSLASKEAGRL